MTEEEWRRHERGAWLRWGVSLVVAMLAAIIAGQCNVQIQPPPVPPQRVAER